MTPLKRAGNGARAQKRFWLLVSFAVFALGCSRRQRPELTALQREFQGLPTDLVPLFVLGDVNEDGKVDGSDTTLVSLLIRRPQQDTSDVPCLAAADASLDGQIDAADLAVIGRIMGESGSARSLPLYRQPYMPCTYGNRVVAAPVEWRSGEPIRVRLLRDLTSRDFNLSVLNGRGEVQPATDGRGWNIVLPPNLATDSLVTVRIALGTSRYTYTLAGFSEPPEEAKSTNTFVEASWTVDSDGDGDVDDPFDVPPPTAWGEEIANVRRCPQEGKGCEALVIDIAKRIRFMYDADRTKSALEAVGCNLSYIAPAFLTTPTSTFVAGPTTLATDQIEIPPSQEALDRVAAANRAAWLQVRAAIATHRANVATGKELAIQLVRAHGDNGGRYGYWSPGWSTLGGSLNRGEFHAANYHAMRGKVCNAVAVDWSCYSGNTARAIERLDNTGSIRSYWLPDVIMNHDFHAAFWGDMASASSKADSTCTNGDAGDRDARMSEVIRSEGRNRDYGRLVTFGFRGLVIDESVGKYNDRGYNRLSGTQCQAASHESAH